MVKPEIKTIWGEANKPIKKHKTKKRKPSKTKKKTIKHLKKIFK